MKILTLVIALSSAFIALTGCKDKEDIEVLWDEWGVAHIYSGSDTRLAYGLGWANMHNHGNQILKSYGLSSGRAAEMWGRDYLESDKRIWGLWVPQTAQQQYNTLTEKERKNLQSFADGINDYAAKHPDELDDELKQVLPITVMDVVQYILVTLYTPDQATLDNIIQTYSTNGLNAQLTAETAATSAASNGWAIGPSKSASGKPLLLSNTHFPWPNNAGYEQLLWHEVHLVGDDTDIYGVGLIGLPALTMGFNDKRAWTVTALSTVDTIDTYELTLTANGYQFDGNEKLFDRQTVVLKVKEPDQSTSGEVLEIRKSVHGPVIFDNGTHALAMKIAIPTKIAGSDLWDMAKAETPEAFLQAMQGLNLPPLHIIYADNEGNILHTEVGAFPDRSNIQYDPALILAGDTSDNLWSDYLTADQIPVVRNPQSGYLQNANEPSWSVTLPTVFEAGDFPQDWPPMNVSLRAASSLKMLTAREQFSLDDVVHDKFSTHSELAERVLDDLLGSANNSVDPVVQQAIQVLTQWDRHFDSDSVGAIVFTFWLLQFAPQTVQGAPFPPNEYAVAFSADQPLSTPRGLANPTEAVAALQKASHAVSDIFGSLYAPWSAMFRFRLNGLDLPGFGAPGSFGVFSANYGAPQPDGKLAPVAGDTWVLALDFADVDNAMAVTTYSNATQADSRHLADQLPLYADKQMRKVWRSKKDVFDHTESFDFIAAPEKERRSR
jgi:acyl-homoserine-lactone acylase